jgi:hypothetical protein
MAAILMQVRMVYRLRKIVLLKEFEIVKSSSAIQGLRLTKHSCSLCPE